MARNIYSTSQLLQVLDSLHKPVTFLLNLAFPQLATFSTAEVSFDRKADNLTLAPFVSPLVQGKGLKTRGTQTSSFAPAYVKPKHFIDPQQVITRQAGERIGGDMSPSARRDLIIQDTLLMQYEQILRRKEWMAAEVLKAGKVTVVGDDYPSAVVDFGRDFGLTLTLTGGNRWGQNGISPYDNVETWMGLVGDACGAAVTDVILGSGAWKNLKSDPKFDKAQDRTLGQINQAEYGMIAGDPNAPKLVASVGGVNYWLYTAIYKDASGTVTKLVDTDGVIMVAAPAVAGIQLHGAILDGSSGYAEAEIWPKNWVENDPAVEFIMTQSAPLVAPGRPNASFYAKTN